MGTVVQAPTAGTVKQVSTAAPARSAVKAEVAPIKPVALASVIKAAQATTTVAGAALDWNVLLGQLSVQGMALQLAKNCVMESFVDGKISLSLAPQHKQFLNNKIAQDKLQAALTDYFAQPIRLSLVVGVPVSAATPATVEKREREGRQQAATEAISEDPFVREAQAQLDAQIIESSIKFIQ